jgi:hypothetical protein
MKTRKTEMRPVSPINRSVFSKNGHGDLRTNFAKKTGDFCKKNGKLNEKIMKNNGMTSTKFVHTNSQ